MNKRIFLIGIFIAAVLLVAACSPQDNSMTGAAKDRPTNQLAVFKSPTCGCCGIYTQYAKKEGFDVTVNELPDLSAIKEQYGIPASIQSCHTSVIGGYFVEGHVPTEAIDKLLAEQPDIAGIAMPGMPSGSPGMPGKKTGTWIVYAIGHDGSISEFTRY